MLLAYASCYAQGYSAYQSLGDPSISMIQINPATSSGTNYGWNFRLGGFGVDLGNSYIAFNNQSISSFIKERQDNLDLINSEISSMSELPILFDFSTYDFQRSSAHFEIEVLGPALKFQIPSGSIGVFSNAKALGFASSPNWNELNDIAELPSLSPFDFPKAKIGAVHYVELGFNYSHIKNIDRETILTLGVNAKFYKGGEYFGARSISLGEAIKHIDSLTLRNVEFEAGVFSNYTYDEETNQSSYRPMYFGNGGGLDLGIQYAIAAPNAKNQNIILGVSVNDIGLIKFKNGNYHHFEVREGYTLKSEFLDESIINELSKDVEIFGAAYNKRGSEKTIWMPTVLNLMADIPINSDLSLGFSSRLNALPANTLKRVQFLTVSPRYKLGPLQIYLPVSYYDFHFIHVGTGIHFGPLRFGSENVMPFLTKSKLKSANLYLSIEITPNDLPKFLRSNSGKRSKNKKSKDDVKCYYF